MGQTLDKPIVEKILETGEGNDLRFAACGMQGWRLEMEDAHTAAVDISSKFPGSSFFAVFDGHAGSNTSKTCSEKLLDHLLKQLDESDIKEFPEDIDGESVDNLKTVIIDAFVSFDDQLKESLPYKSGKETCGSTALCVLVTPHWLAFCNVGDSRAFLARDDTVIFETKDHKPSDFTERNRIEASGNSVIMDRVNGNLAVSRAFGDFSFKENKVIPTVEQSVSPEPTVTFLKRDKDQFMVLACDGIWDVMTCESVREFVSVKLQCCGDLSKACTALIDACLLKDSRDNMTVLVVAFSDAPKFDEEKKEKDLLFESEIKNYIEEQYGSGKITSLYLTSTINALNSCTFTDSLASSIGTISKVEFIESVINELDPNRSVDRDYATVGISSFPIALQAIQQLVNENSINSPLNDSSPEYNMDKYELDSSDNEVDVDPNDVEKTPDIETPDIDGA